METYGKAKDLFSLEGCSAVVTGGTKGIGKAIATGLLENGADVFIVSRNVSEMDEMRLFAENLGRRCIPYSCDVTDSKKVVDLALEVQKTFGKADILFNCAGMNIIQFLQDIEDDSWRKVIDTNLTAVMYVSREISKLMIQKGYGRIINISSMKAFLGTSSAGYTAYCATKGAINMMTKQMACELAKYNITCNAIAPTFIKTDINAKMLDDPAFLKSLEERIPLGRIGTFKDIVSLALFLASDASGFLTGLSIPLDGGIMARQ